MSGNTVRTLVTGLLLVSLVSKLPTDAFAQSPQNSVVMVGGQTMFTCDFGLASWDLSRDGSSNALFIAKDCVIAPGFSSNYITEKSTNSCELIVINVTMQHAGVYTCNNTAEGIAKRAVLTVIEIPAKAETNVSGNVTEGESLVLNCSIKYNGSVAPASILRPKLHWAEINTRSYYSNPNEAVSKATFRVGRQDKLQFTCRVYFLLTLDTSNSTTYAPNTPSEIYTVRTVRMDVYYGPGNLTISENDRNGHRIVVELNCSSSANPPAEYKWTDVTHGTDKRVVSNTSSYSEAERNRVYECTAYNYIRGRRHEASTNYTVPPSNYTVPPIKYTSVPNNPIPNSTVPRISSTSAPNNTIPNSTVAVPTFSPNPSTEVSSIQVSDSAKISTAKASAIQFSDTTKISTGLGWTRNPVGQQETAGQSTSWSLGGNKVPDFRWWIIVAAVGGFVVSNLFCMTCFLIYYNIGDGDKKQNRRKLNRQFPWLVQMLPCLNKGGCCSSSCWPVLFIIMSLLLGLFVFPMLVMIVCCFYSTCCFKGEQLESEDSSNKSQSSSDHEEKISHTSHQPNGRYQEIQLDHYSSVSPTSPQRATTTQDGHIEQEIQYAELQIPPDAIRRPVSMDTKPPSDVYYAEIATA